MDASAVVGGRLPIRDLAPDDGDEPPNVLGADRHARIATALPQGCFHGAE
jgi:hypothetical protein